MSKASEINSKIKSITESPIAQDGDMDISKFAFGNVGKLGLQKNYFKLPNIRKPSKLDRDIEVYISTNFVRVICGYWSAENNFRVISEMWIEKYENENKKFIQSSNIGTLKEMVDFGYGSALYLSLLDSGYTIISDWVQYDGDRKLWKNLSIKYDDIVVDVYDEIEDEFIKLDHKIISTDIKSLDKEWSKNIFSDKKHILFVARKK